MGFGSLPGVPLAIRLLDDARHFAVAEVHFLLLNEMCAEIGQKFLTEIN